MKGLFYKDLIQFRQMGKVLLVLIAFFCVLVAMSGPEGIGSLAISTNIMLTIIFCINLFAYDERAKWDGYALSLPIGRSRIVLARYLLIFALSAALALLFWLGALVSGGLSVETGLEIGAGFAVALLFSAVFMPLFYKFGLQKARLWIVVIAMAPYFLILIWKKAYLPVPSFSSANWGLLLVVLPLAVLLLYGVSFLISRAAYRGKEV